MKMKLKIISIIAVLFLILVSFSNVVGYNTIKTSQEELIESKYSFDECKEYLFQTLVEISNNPEIKDIIKSNYQPQRTILPFRRNNVELKVEHLELLYEMGLKIMDRLGEERVEELMENIEIPEYIDEIDTIIMGNDELRERIYTLNEMNAESDKLELFFPIICDMLLEFYVFTDIIVNKFIDLWDYCIEINMEFLFLPFMIFYIPILLLSETILGVYTLLCSY